MVFLQLIVPASAQPTCYTALICFCSAFSFISKCPLSLPVRFKSRLLSKALPLLRGSWIRVSVPCAEIWKALMALWVGLQSLKSLSGTMICSCLCGYCKRTDECYQVFLLGDITGEWRLLDSHCTLVIVWHKKTGVFSYLCFISCSWAVFLKMRQKTMFL